VQQEWPKGQDITRFGFANDGAFLRIGRNGPVVGIAYVQEGDEVLLITQQGMIIRMQTNDVRAIGRATQGVRLIDVEGEDKVVSIARLVEKEEDDKNGESEPPPGEPTPTT